MFSPGLVGRVVAMLRLCSAFAGVYTEFLLKKLEYSTDFQNMLLYSWGVAFCLLGAHRHTRRPAALEYSV